MNSVIESERRKEKKIRAEKISARVTKNSGRKWNEVQLKLEGLSIQQPQHSAAGS